MVAYRILIYLLIQACLCFYTRFLEYSLKLYWSVNFVFDCQLCQLLKTFEKETQLKSICNVFT